MVASSPGEKRNSQLSNRVTGQHRRRERGLANQSGEEDSACISERTFGFLGGLGEPNVFPNNSTVEPFWLHFIFQCEIRIEYGNGQLCKIPTSPSCCLCVCRTRRYKAGCPASPLGEAGAAYYVGASREFKGLFPHGKG